ncbi:MAG: hypothetical protein WKG32_16415, partial [Gemmatimonadaceae bacterium]
LSHPLPAAMVPIPMRISICIQDEPDGSWPGRRRARNYAGIVTTPRAERAPMSEIRNEFRADIRRVIHVVIATRTLVPIVAEILWAAIVGQPDMTLRTTDVAPEALVSDEALEDADVLVIGDALQNMPATQRRLAYAHPHTGILAISADARYAELVALRPQRTRLDVVTPGEILAAIRNAASETMTEPG